MDIVDNDYMKELTKILESVGERIEGNLVCDITPTNWVIHDNIDKIKNLQYLCKNKKKIIEIGVNACHSLLLMLLINPEAEYLLFDLNCHKYTEHAFNYIKSQFPSTKINIIFGDSTKTMHKFIVDNQTELHSYDLIHIDGGHTIDIFFRDYNNSKQLSVNNGIVVFDDYDYDSIYTFIQKMITQKEIIEYTDSNIIRTRLHFVYTYL